MTKSALIGEFEDAARQAEAAEQDFRRTMNERVADLARERAFAFRRMNVMRSLLDTVERAESREIAVAGALAALRQRLGWRDDSQARDEVLARYARLAEAAFAEIRTDDRAEEEQADGLAPPALREALAEFERWYAETRGTPFWVLFEHYMPETQLVDF